MAVHDGMHMTVSLAAGEMDYTVHLESSLRILAFLQGLAAKMTPPPPEPVPDEVTKQLTRMATRTRHSSRQSSRQSFAYVANPSAV